MIEFNGYFNSIIWPMIALGQIISLRSRAKASLKRISSFLEVKSQIIRKFLANSEQSQYHSWIDLQLKKTIIKKDSTLINSIKIETKDFRND